MTKSQNTKNEQLTEQCKKGELTGEYWCEITESPYPERVYLPTCDSDIIVKVLAPVPSYDEWQAKLKENAQLKELLKECREYMQDIQGQIEEDEYTMARNTAKLVKTKIDEVLK